MVDTWFNLLSIFIKLFRAGRPATNQLQCSKKHFKLEWCFFFLQRGFGSVIIWSTSQTSKSPEVGFTFFSIFMCVYACIFHWWKMWMHRWKSFLPLLIPVRLLSNFGMQDDHWLVRSELKVLTYWISVYFWQRREMLILPSDAQKHIY